MTTEHGILTPFQTASSAVMNNYGRPSLELVRGEGVYLYDSEGTSFLDFAAGIAVCNLGHAHPAVTDAIVRQASTLVHTSNLYGHPERTRLASRLTEAAGLNQAFFCNSGTEANEAALKLARKYASVKGQPNRTEFVSLPHAFHGRTLGSLSVTPKAAYQEGYHPLVPGCRVAATFEETIPLITEQTAACIVEVVQGEGGVRPIPTDILQSIAARCKEVGALLIVDEVQTGMGRTGTLFAFQATGITPDIVTIAKGLGNGVPVGAVLASAEVATAFGPGSHGSTFGGNLLAMAAAHVVLNHVATDSFLAHVRDIGSYLQDHLESRFKDVTGRGLMWGVTVDDSAAFVAQAASCGLLLTSAGPQRVRFIPPLIVESVHVDEAMRVLDTMISSL